MPSTALIVIATGQRYWPYIGPLVQSAKKYFLDHDVILFTDSPDYHVPIHVRIPALGFPGETLFRYHTILAHRYLFWPYEHVFYADVDMLFVDKVGDEILANGITATLHAGYVDSQSAPWERHTSSTAYIQPGKERAYYVGGFNGGTRDEYLHMATTIRNGVDTDATRGIMAIWHDESHLNYYLSEYPPAITLSPAYCFPETELANPRWKPKIICLEKSLR